MEAHHSYCQLLQTSEVKDLLRRLEDSYDYARLAIVFTLDPDRCIDATLLRVNLLMNIPVTAEIK
jgi:hypothetical protein